MSMSDRKFFIGLFAVVMVGYLRLSQGRYSLGIAPGNVEIGGAALLALSR